MRRPPMGTQRLPGWTVETLRQHLTAVIAELDRRITQRFEAMDRAVTVAYEEIRRWQASQNEWRGAMSDRDRLVMSRSEIETREAAQDRRIEALERLASQSQGRQLGLPWIYGGIGAVVAVVSIVVSMVRP